MPPTSMRIESTVVKLCPMVRLATDQSVGAQLDEKLLWEEALRYLLSSQVQFALADAVAQKLVLSGVLRRNEVRDDSFNARLVALLSEPVLVNGRLRRYRFPGLAAKRIFANLQHFCSTRQSLSNLVYSEATSDEIRRNLIDQVVGFGPKQSSMFLRNIGRTYDLAIIDRHVLRYMAMVGLIPDRSPTRIQGQRYWEVEKLLRLYSEALGYAVGCVDVAIWIVMTSVPGRLK